MYDRVNWINEEEGTTTPLNAENLNQMDEGIADIDERVTALEDAPAPTTDAFATVKVGEINVEADGTDTLTLKAGNNVRLSADPETKEITIESTGGGGGGGASSWDDLEDKPFETVGSDFNVDNNELQLSSAIIAKLQNIDTTVKTSTVGSDGKTVSFTNIDTSKCYKPYAEVGTSFTDRKPVGMESITLNGNTLTYVLTNASAGMEIKLREIKL